MREGKCTLSYFARHVSWKSILLIGLIMWKTTLTGGDQGGSHKTGGWDKINSTKSGLEWEK